MVEPGPTGDAILEQALDQVVDQYAAVEPDPAAFRQWMNAARAGAAPLRRRPRPLRTPVWLALAAALALVLGLAWYRSRAVARQAAATRALLAQHNEKVVIHALPGAPPLSTEDQQRIQKLEQNPNALAHEPMPGAPVPLKKKPGGGA